jgi:head-tail adaptor
VLSAKEIAGLRSEAARTLTDSCTIQRNTPTSDGAGGQTDSWATLSTPACRFVPAKQPTESLIAAAVAGRQAYDVFLPASTDVTRNDRLARCGRTYEVVGVLLPTVEVNRHVVAVELS